MGDISPVNVFLDFEASSLAKASYPIEVAWVFEDGRSETHLIAPAPEWTDWDTTAQAIHGIDRQILVDEGEPHHVVAAKMVEALTGHQLFASAPSWDGKWLSTLMRAAGLPRRLLQIQDTDAALHRTATELLSPVFLPDRLPLEVHNLIARASSVEVPEPDHRALADALGEYRKWQAIRNAAEELLAMHSR